MLVSISPVDSYLLVVGHAESHNKMAANKAGAALIGSHQISINHC